MHFPPTLTQPLVSPSSDLITQNDAIPKLEGRWDHQKHVTFLNAIIRYGKDWKKVQQQVNNRNGPQVRSHAQKYFLKINKIIKDRKKIKGKKMPDITDVEFQLKQYFASHPFTSHTPKQIIQLLKIEKVGIKNLIQQNSNGNQRLIIQQLLAPTPKLSIKKIQAKIPCPPAKILKSFQNQVNEGHDDSSFLTSLMRKNMEFFFNGGPFSAFIDFKGESKKTKTMIYQQETQGHRKQSFANFDQESNEN